MARSRIPAVAGRDVPLRVLGLLTCQRIESAAIVKDRQSAGVGRTWLSASGPLSGGGPSATVQSMSCVALKISVMCGKMRSREGVRVQRCPGLRGAVPMCRGRARRIRRAVRCGTAAPPAARYIGRRRRRHPRGRHSRNARFWFVRADADQLRGRGARSSRRRHVLHARSADKVAAKESAHTTNGRSNKFRFVPKP